MTFNEENHLGQSKLFNNVRQFCYVRRKIIKNVDAKIVGPFLIQCQDNSW